MEAKDTVMSWDKIIKLTGFVSDFDSHPAKRMRELSERQAEISFRAGIREVMEELTKLAISSGDLNLQSYMVGLLAALESKYGKPN